MSRSIVIAFLVNVFLLTPGATQRRPSATRQSPYAVQAAAVVSRVGGLRVLRCAAVDGRRIGFCEVGAIDRMPMDRMRRVLRANTDDPRAEGWRTSPNNPCARWLAAHPDAEVLTIPSDVVLARNGTRLRRIWIEKSRACLDMSIPWS